MREGMIADRVASSRQVANLGGVHRLPVLPLLVAGSGVRINPRPIESERLVGGALRKGRHDEKHSAATKGFKQGSGDGVVALPSIVKSEQELALKAGGRIRMLLPQLGETLQTCNRETLRRPLKLVAEIRRQGSRGLVHPYDQRARASVALPHAERKLVHSGQSGGLNQ